MTPNPDCNPDWRRFWLLESDVVFLNHGSFGACPLPVLQVQQQFREQLERQPLRFVVHELEPLLDQARQRLGEFVGADPADLVFVNNATTGINAVLRSLCSTDHRAEGGTPVLQAGDEVLTTDHEYNACRNALNFIAARFGLQVRVATIPFPLESADQMVQAILAQVTPRTRLALLDHVTSQTALIFPLERVIAALRDRHIPTLIDGAHAPGMIPLNLTQLGATYYTGNCHKWLCAPKGAAFLYVQPDCQPLIRPLTISHGANSPRRDRSRFQLEFDWCGTDDPSAVLSIPAAIDFLGSLLPGGWPALMQHNHDLAIAARQHLCQAWGIALPCPDDLIGSMASLPLPDGSYTELQTALINQFQIEIPVIPWPAEPKRLIRLSAQLYNRPDEYEQLAIAVLNCVPVSGNP